MNDSRTRASDEGVAALGLRCDVRGEGVADRTAPAEHEERASPSALSEQFRAIFVRELAYVVRSLRRLGVRHEEVEDMAQEVFLAAHVHLDRYDPSRPVRPWLFAFAARVAANYRRLSRHTHEVAGL